MTRILLTSFTTWKAHQQSNASDDLLIEIQKHSSADLFFLRQLPVDFRLAPEQAIAHFNQLQPDAIILCGMAESRQKLTVESRAIAGETVFHAKVELRKLIEGLEFTEISHDAGQFVCEALYFATLKHLREANSDCLCMFVHIPILTLANSQLVINDFQAMIEYVRSEVCQVKARTDAKLRLGVSN